MKKFSIMLAIGTALSPIPVFAQDSSEVIMRRPLPGQPSNSTETPPENPPEPEEPVDPEEGGDLGVFYGWRSNCEGSAPICVINSYEGDGSLSQRNLSAEDCPSSQSNEANAAARSIGLHGLDEGVTSTNQDSICDSAPPSGNFSFYGWDLDCSVPSLSCMKVNVVQNESGGSSESISEVDKTECPDQQSSAFNQLAEDMGWIGMGMGIHSGTKPESCNPPPPSTYPVDLHVGVSSCWEEVKEVDCIVHTYQDEFDWGSWEFASDPSICETPANTNHEKWSDIVFQYEDNIVSSDEFAQEYATRGESCGADYGGNPTPPEYVYGYRCDNDVEAQCVEIGYQSTENGIKVVELWEDNGWGGNPPGCEGATHTSDELDVLNALGFSPNSNVCAAPSFYGARGKCVSNVEYDVGWPQSGQAHVTTGYETECYAVRNFGTSGQNFSRVDGSLCENQTLTAQERNDLRTLAPALQPYDELDRTCEGTEILDPNYQTSWPELIDEQGPDGVPGRYLGQKNTSEGTFYYMQQRLTYNFVCTDTSENYFGVPSSFHSTYPIDTSPCYEDYLNDYRSAKTGTASEQATNRLRNGCRQEEGITNDMVVQCSATAESNGQDTITILENRWVRIHM